MEVSQENLLKSSVLQHSSASSQYVLIKKLCVNIKTDQGVEIHRLISI